MSFISVLVLIFSSIAAVDYLFGNKLGLGKEFENAFKMLGTLALSMIGMIVISPLIAEFLDPVFDGMYKFLHIDPSLLPAMLFANDMGGAPLADAVAKEPEIGRFNALVVSSMMGATVSFTIPFSLGAIKTDNRREFSLGLLCGVVTVPVGCLTAGLVCRLPFGALCLNLLPLVLLSAVIAAALILFTEGCIKAFRVIGFLIKILVVSGLVIGILNALFDKEIVKGAAPIEEGALICMDICIVMAGMFPLIFIISKLLSRPLGSLGGRIGINETSMTGLISTLATNVTTFGIMDRMDKKGVMINSAFAVSAAFVFADHLAFTMAYDPEYILPLTVGKLVGGASALILAFILHAVFEKRNGQKAE